MYYQGHTLDERLYKDCMKEKPSLVEDSTYKGYRYFITTMCRFPCAYIVIPEGIRYPYDLEVNGGISYTEKDHWAVGNLNQTIIGWDYDHCWDIAYYPYEKHYYRDEYTRAHTLEGIRYDCEKAIDEIIEYNKKEEKEETE